MGKDIRAGYKCDCCGQFVKAYCRPLNSGMALVVLLISKFGNKEFFHVEGWLKSIGRPELRADFHKLRFWGLLEAKIENREDGSKRNGYYRITGRGLMFAECKLTVPKKVVLLNNKFEGFEGEEINIKQALGSKFNYQEMMQDFAPKTDKEKQGYKQLSLI